MLTKKFRIVENTLSPLSLPSGKREQSTDNMGYKNYQSYLPDVYSGHPNRVDRYMQYESMDMDSEINIALDVLAEFCTGKSEETRTPFEFEYHGEASDTEIKLLNEEIVNWCRLNDFNNRIFKIFRNTIKYGDQIFIRDPETFELFWVEMSKVVRVIVNESEGKTPEYYVITELGPNFENLTATAPAYQDTYNTTPSIGGPTTSYAMPGANFTGQNRFGKNDNESNIEAEHICHLTLTEGLDATFPFGTSLLENIFKVFKQKELLEDAIIIYRVQRAPERRVFYIDVGGMPTHMAMTYVERVKNEIHQRRIPTQTGGGSNVMDTTYNPLSINEDYFFPQTETGRGSKVDTLPGGENLGQIDDLRYFTNKLFRGLRIPPSYIPTGPEQQSNPYVDGKVGTALIEEDTFNKYCKRLQRQVISPLDYEFKMYLAWKGYNIENSLFSLNFTEPQNFAAYRMIELDSTRINTFNSIKDTDYLSKRFMLKKYLQLTPAEMQENEELLLEEMGESTDKSAQGDDLRAADISPGGIESDMDEFGLDDEPFDDELSDEEAAPVEDEIPEL